MKLKLRDPLTKEARAKLTAFIAEAREGLEYEQGEDQKKTNLFGVHARLARDVKTLQARFDADDLDVLGELTAQKQQLALVSSKINAPLSRPISQRKGPSWNWFELMKRMHEFIRPFIITCQEELRKEIIATFRPFYGTDAGAREAAGNTAVLLALSNFIGMRILNLAEPKRCVILLVEVSEKMLAGEVFWSFDPNSKKK